MSQIFEYFVVCGIGPEIRSIDGTKGYHGPGWMYLPSLLDQYPPSTHTLYPPPPPQLPTVSFFINNNTTKISSNAFSWTVFYFQDNLIMSAIVDFSVFYRLVLSFILQDLILTILPRFRGVIRLFWPVCFCISIFYSIYRKLLFVVLWCCCKYLRKLDILYRRFLHRYYDLSNLGSISAYA
jgi:hypothetical protein